MKLHKKFIKKYNNLETGIPDIDIQHKALFETIQKLEQNMGSKNVIWNVLLDIETYVGFHFETEKKYMEKFQYPEMDEHIKEHDDFAKEFVKLKTDFDEKEFCSIFVEDIYNFLLKWICRHYEDTDIKLTAFLKQKLSYIKD